MARSNGRKEVMNQIKKQFFGASFAFLLLFAPLATADEGMWTYNNLPVETLREKYGFEPSKEWTDHLMKSSVRFNSGGSGSFISKSGLVLTNHHVGADTLAKISTAEHDYYREGFLARTQAEEIKAPDLELNQLVSIEDVTDRVNEAVKPSMTSSEASLARRAAIAKIEKESLENTGLRSDVVTLYQGGQYQLYRYKKYTDVRLVFSPEFDIAFFGGDPDNFEYPRFNLDMCIFRVYENGQPAEIEHFLKWSTTGTSENELVFVSGHPGSTRRMYTLSALAFLRDFRVPYQIEYLNRQEIMLQQFGGKGIEEARRAKEDLFSVQNGRKVYYGRIKGLQDPELFRKKQEEENKILAEVKARPELKELAGAWETIQSAQKVAKKLLVKRSLLEGGQAFNSHLFGIARTLVRLAEESQKPNDERLPEYRDSNRSSLEQQLYSEAPIYEDLEVAKLTDALTYFVTKFGEKNELVKKVLEGKSPAERATELVERTSLKNVSVRRLLAEGGNKAIAESYDSMVLLAKAVDASSRAIRKTYEEKVEEPERQAYAQIAKALFAIKGTKIYPDATFTLRLSFGQVKGYSEAGQSIPAFTTLGGAFDHEKKHGNTTPFQLPASWHEKMAEIKLDTPFNFVSTADIIGGNSGSPTVNQAGELVGLIFDGNIHSLVSDYFYEDRLNRAVSVDSRGMMEVLNKIYQAKELVSELTR
jgi:hypothetical protein